MLVELEPIALHDKPVLQNLMQLYMYDTSEYDHWAISEHGLFSYSYIDHYWTEKGRHPFFIRVDGKLAGLALVRTIYGATQEEMFYSMSGFFVMRQYRGRGVGKKAAYMLFDRFPGEWHVGETHENKPAQAFWRDAIADYAGGCYVDEERVDEDFHWLKGPVQTFRSSGKTLVYLIRHAEAVHSADEVERPLTARGLHDAGEVARTLAYENLDAVFSSPYRRAMQTVEPLAAQAGTTVQLLPCFRERCLATDAVDIDEALLRTWRDFSFSYPGGESNSQAQARGVAAVEQLALSQAGRRVAVGTHGTLLGLILNHFAPGQYDLAYCRHLDLPDIYLLVFDGAKFSWATKVWRRTGDRS